MNSLILSLAILCQTPKPPATIYIFGGLKEEARTCETVLYDGKDWTLVPVINGFVPQISHRGADLVYDYTQRIRLADVQHRVDLERLPHPIPVKQVPAKSKLSQRKIKTKVKSAFDSKLKRPADIDEPDIYIRPNYTYDGPRDDF